MARASISRPGAPASLVKLLALHGGGPAQVDNVIESLWPGVEPSSGRKRLRNVLNRLRESVGDLVERDGEALSLIDGTVVDAVLFEQRALEAFAEAGEAASFDRARAALALYAGEALPDERYEEWAVEPVSDFGSVRLISWDLLAAGAERDGDLDDALRLLERAIEADRIDEAPISALGRASVATGQARKGAGHAPRQRRGARRARSRALCGASSARPAPFSQLSPAPWDGRGTAIP